MPIWEQDCDWEPGKAGSGPKVYQGPESWQDVYERYCVEDQAPRDFIRAAVSRQVHLRSPLGEQERERCEAIGSWLAGVEPQGFQTLRESCARDL